MVLAKSWSERKSRSVTLIRKIRSAVAKGPFDRRRRIRAKKPAAGYTDLHDLLCPAFIELMMQRIWRPGSFGI